MAIQGQSWGGYQVAYLITQTNMFKAAGSWGPGGEYDFCFMVEYDGGQG